MGLDSPYLHQKYFKLDENFRAPSLRLVEFKKITEKFGQHAGTSENENVHFRHPKSLRLDLQNTTVDFLYFLPAQTTRVKQQPHRAWQPQEFFGRRKSENSEKHP